MQQRKAEKELGIYRSMLVPPGLSFLQVGQEQEKRHQQDEEDYHFEQYVDECKRQTTIDKSPFKKHKGKKRIIKLIKNNSSCKSLDEHKNQSEKKSLDDQISSAQVLCDDIQLNQDEIKQNNNETLSQKDKSNQKYDNLNVNQAGTFDDESNNQSQNLVDKFLVAVISPTKQRQNRNLDSFLKDQSIQDVNNSSPMKKESSFSQIYIQKSQQINELLNKQKQILVEQLNKNHSQSINFNDQSYLRNSQNHDSNMKQDDSNLLIFQNRRSLTSKKLSQNTNQQSKNNLISSKQQAQQQLINENLQKVSSNSQFTIGHYLGEYQHSQSLFLQNKTMDSLQNDNTQKSTQNKTLFEIKKLQQINQLQEKYKQTQINKQQVDFNLQSISEKINQQTNSTIQSTSNNNQQSSSTENVLQQISNSNIGFGIPLQKKLETNQKGLKINLNQLNKNIKQNPKIEMIYYNNLAQVNRSESKNKSRQKPSLSISPNGYLNQSDQNMQYQKTFQRLNESTTSSQTHKNFNFNQNSIFDTLGNKDKQLHNNSFLLKDQNNYLNRSFDLTLNIAKRIKQEKENKYNSNIEQCILNNRNENSILLNSSNMYYNSDNSLQTKNSGTNQSNTRNLSPINFLNNSQNLAFSSFNQISSFCSSNLGKNNSNTDTSKSKTQYPANPFISVSPIMGNPQCDFENRRSETEINEEDEQSYKINQEKSKQKQDNTQFDFNAQKKQEKEKLNQNQDDQKTHPLQLNKLNNEDFLSQISQSNIGFGLPFSNKHLTNQKRLKYQYNNYQNNKQSIQNAKHQMIVLANNQVSLSQTNYSKQNRSKTSLSLTPNRLQNNFDEQFQSQKTQYQQNQTTHQQTNKKFTFYQNLDQSNKDQLKSQKNQQSNNQNNQLNKSHDLCQNLENQQQIQNLLHNNRNDNCQNTNGKIYQTHYFVNQKNSFSTRNAVILQNNSRNISPINYQITQNMQLSPINYQTTQNMQLTPINSPLNQINTISKAGQIVIVQSKNQNSSAIFGNFQNEQSNHIFNTEGDEEFIKKRRNHLNSLKRSPQKGISAKTKSKQDNNNTQNITQNTQVKIKNYNLDKISSATGVSPSQIRKSLQNHLIKNNDNLQSIQDPNKSIQNLNHDQLFAFQPLSKNIKTQSEQNDFNIQNQFNQLTPTNIRSKVVGNKKYIIKGVIELQFDQS